ncbi:MAG: histidine kinase [Chitinophagales bacterium]
MQDPVAVPQPGGRLAAGTNGPLMLERIDAVMHETVAAVQHGKEKIFQVGDLAREEHARLSQDLEALRNELAHRTVHIAELEQRARQARTSLAEISRDFNHASEESIRRAYATAEQAQVDLSVAQAQVADLVRRRQDLEAQRQRVANMMSKAEELTTAVGLAIEFLTGRIAGQSSTLRYRTSGIGTQVIKAQEEERRRIAREIHDGPAQAMANIVLRAEICEKTMDTGKGDLKVELADLKRLAKDCLKEVRRIIFDLRPMTLDDLGLAPTLTRYCEELAKQVPFQIRFVVYGKERRLDAGVEAALFRLVQEALTNARKYAKPLKVEVKVEFLPGLIRAVVEDDGVGFDPADLQRLQGKKDEHFGLLGMRERVQLFDGELTVTSAPGKGTTVVAQIPVEGGR